MIIAVIPAQSRSTRLAGKNMKEILGKPMIDYTIEYAQRCKLISEIYVSTDSDEIARYAIRKGVKALIRTPELCGDVAIVEVLKHCIRNIPQGESVSYVVALQVDHPDRTADITDLLKRAIDNKIVDTITVDSNGIRNGSVRILRKQELMEDKISYSIIAVKDECTNIHYQKDFDKAVSNIVGNLRNYEEK